MSDTTERVLQVVQSIPTGRVMTYGDIAHEVRTGARMVGRVLHHGGHDIPWWRVVDATGRPYRAAAPDALSRFLEEGTPLVEESTDVRVDLARASWHPPVHPTA